MISVRTFLRFFNTTKSALQRHSCSVFHSKSRSTAVLKSLYNRIDHRFPKCRVRNMDISDGTIFRTMFLLLALLFRSEIFVNPHNSCWEIKAEVPNCFEGKRGIVLKFVREFPTKCINFGTVRKRRK